MQTDPRNIDFIPRRVPSNERFSALQIPLTKTISGAGRGSWTSKRGKI